jgi:peptidoglycan hydrolase-like protein with peptidoglycan-binding domain
MRSRTATALAVPAVLVALAGCAGSSSSQYVSDTPPSYPASAAPTARKAAAPPSYGVPTPVPSRTQVRRVVTPPPPPPPRPAPAPTSFDGLKPGDHGDQVRALQQQLQALHFWVGSTDGNYGTTTTQAVMAVQKAAGLTPDGVMGSRTRDALARGVSVAAHSSGGHWVEINKAKQLAMLVDNGQVAEVFNTSTGSGKPYTQDGKTSIANTPSGRFTIFRQVDRLDPGPLGDLWRPKYFNGGIALHGDGFVPGYPASHGCARISNQAIDWIWANDQAPIGTHVWVY